MNQNQKEILQQRARVMAEPSGGNNGSSAPRPQPSPSSNRAPGSVPIPSSGPNAHIFRAHSASSCNNLSTTFGSQQTNSSQLQARASHYSRQQQPYIHSGFQNLVAAAATLAQQSQEIQNYPTNYDPHHYAVAAAAAAANRTWNASYPHLQPTKRSYTTGVDELIMAARIEDSSSRAAASESSRFLQPSLSSADSSAYSSYLTPSKSSCHTHYRQQPTFLAPNAAPHVPIGRGLGYPAYLSSNTCDNPTQLPALHNKSELDLYHLLEKANLTQYFDTFLKYGGDDVQQLSDADEEEFIEIMKLIGMTDKPLHIRRLQKALSEWRETQSVYDSIDSSLKRPSFSHSSRQDQPGPYDAHGLYCGQIPSDRFALKSSAFLVDSPAPTPANSELSQPPFPVNEPIQQFCTPLEVIVGAPKRPRLMDSIKPRDLTKTYHSDIPTPDARQLNVKQAIIDKRKRAKKGLEQLPRTLERSGDNDSKLTPTSSPRASPNWDTSQSSCDSSEEDDDKEKKRNQKGDGPTLKVHSAPGRKSKVRTSLLERFNNSARDKQLPASEPSSPQKISKN